MEKLKVKKFKAKAGTLRFRYNQDIWIQLESPNHLRVVHKWRGKGRYVSAIIGLYPNAVSNKVNKVVGSLDNIKTIEVESDFAIKNDLQVF